MTTYKELLATCFKSKKVEYIYIYIYIYTYIYTHTVCAKSNQISASKNCLLATLGSSGCQSYSWHVQQSISEIGPNGLSLTYEIQIT